MSSRPHYNVTATHVRMGWRSQRSQMRGGTRITSASAFRIGATPRIRCPGAVVVHTARSGRAPGGWIRWGLHGHASRRRGTMAIRLGDEAPNFEADTTEGKVNFHDWKDGSWAVLF